MVRTRSYGASGSPAAPPSAPYDLVRTMRPYAEMAQDLDHGLNVAHHGDVAQRDRSLQEKRRRHVRKHGVLGAAGPDRSPQPARALDADLVHGGGLYAYAGGARSALDQRFVPAAISCRTRFSTVSVCFRSFRSF